MEIQGKIAVITGGAGGIGLAVVKKLLSKGLKFIALFELDNPNTRAIFNELEKEYGTRVGFYPTDVTNSAQFAGNLEKVLETYKTIDILLNNAGIIDENTFELMIDINYKALVLGTLKYIDLVGKHKGGKGGVVINTASILGFTNLELPVYCSTKHAVVSFTRTMDEQYENTGVRVVAVCPGLTETPLVHQVTKGLDFITIKGKVTELPIQSPENVAVGVVKLIETAKSGDIVVAEENLPPYQVRDIDNYKNLRINE